ncbi:MAG: hypothetical protein ACPG21_03065 [Crocinitomicaceae bacterium]
MKKVITGIGLLALVSCGGYSEEQGSAAEEMCACMEADAFGDFDINYFECDAEVKGNHGTEVFEEGSWIEALEEKCPDLAAKLNEQQD